LLTSKIPIAWQLSLSFPIVDTDCDAATFHIKPLGISLSEESRMRQQTMTSPHLSMSMPDGSTSAPMIDHNNAPTNTTSAGPPPAGSLPAIRVTAPSETSLSSALVGFPLPSHNRSIFTNPVANPEHLPAGNHHYSSDHFLPTTTDINMQVDRGSTSRPRFQRLVTELAEACTQSTSAVSNRINTVAAGADPEEYLGHILEDWNRSKAMDLSGASTPQAADIDEVDGDEGTPTKIKVTLIFK
jgi:hypothetical protein